MKLSDQITRRQLFVAFGSSMQSGGLSSVDLVATRDPDRVILTASDGSAAPVEGANPAAAGVMTAADKVKLDALPPVSFREFAARSEIANAAIGAGITHLRTAGHAAVGDGGGAVYRRAGAEPAHALKVQSADGAWWELVPQNAAIDVRQAGARGDGVSNDGQAFLDALAGVASFNVSGIEEAVHTVRVPPGDYYLGATTLELKKVVRLAGDGSGIGNFPKPAVLRWDANVTGIIVHDPATIGAGQEGAATGGADGSIIEGLHLVSAGGTVAGVTDATKGHGIWLRRRAVLRNLEIEGFPGNGLNIVANGAGGPDTLGNANGWYAEACRVSLCGLSGMFVDGADVNAGIAVGVSCASNGRWGIWDSSFLGNTYLGCQSSGNGNALAGFNGGAVSSNASFGGTTYVTNPDATEADYVAMQPGTNVGVWIAHSGLVNAIAWTGGQAAGTYVAGGAYRTDNVNARNTLIGCYTEPGQGPAQLERPTVFLGGHQLDLVKGSSTGAATGMIGENVYGRHRFLHSHRWLTTGGVTRADLEAKFNDAAATLLSVTGDGIGNTALARWIEADGQWGIGTQGTDDAKAPITITTEVLTQSFGRASTADVGIGKVAFRRGFYLGPESGGTQLCRFWSNGTAAPTTGSRARGEIVWNRDPSSSGPLGWVCVASGTPGTWAEIRGVGTQQASIAAPAGGTTVDAEARTAINSILAVLEHFGLTANA